MYASSAGKLFALLAFLVVLLVIGDRLPIEEGLFVLVVDRPLRDDDCLPRPFSSLRGLISFLRLPLSEDLAGEDALFPMITCGMLPSAAGCGVVVVVRSSRGSTATSRRGFQHSWKALEFNVYVRPDRRSGKSKRSN